MSPSNLVITNSTRAKIPRVPFHKIKDAVLGKPYRLSLSFVPPKEIAKLNLIYRNKKGPTDILSFPLSKKEGEIYICPTLMRTESKKFDRSYPNFAAFLFIHGLVHLKGHDHGSTMERTELKFRRKFGI